MTTLRFKNLTTSTTPILLSVFSLMANRKLVADKIFDGTRFRTNAALIISDNGTVVDLVPSGEAPGAEVFEGILIPGFVNAHCHLELSHMRGQLPERTGLIEFVKRIISQRAQDPDFISDSIIKAEDEMLVNGIMAVGDISNTSDTAFQKRKGRISYYNFVEVLGWTPASAKGSYERALEVQREFGDCGPAAIVPHASYTVSENLWNLIEPQFAGHTISVHNQETPDEDEFIRTGGGGFPALYAAMGVDNSHHVPAGVSSLQSYLSKLHAAKNRLLIHNTMIEEEDVRFALASSPAGTTYFGLCINANLYIENKVPPVELLRRLNAPIVIGTDSLASNWSLGIHDELRSLRTYFPQVPLEEMLGWATLNGARALQMEDRLGSFEKGKTPGVLLLQEEDLSVKRIV
jgi:cytosine/adenosine deaminase-related metal-dependent hydrolase